MKKVFEALGGMISVEVETGNRDENAPQKKWKNINVNDPDIPYEVRMKHIIKQYIKDQKKWEQMSVYTKHLEAEVIRLKNALIINGYTDDGVVGTSKPGAVIQELEEKIATLKKKYKELKKKDNVGKVIELENRINRIYPERKYKIVCFKRVIKSQTHYIEELQKILDEHNIAYHPKMPINDLETEDIDTIDENAVRNESD
jgi:hypothetical protein